VVEVLASGFALGVIESGEHVGEIEVRPRPVIDDVRRRFTHDGVMERGYVVHVLCWWPPTLAARTSELDGHPDRTQHSERKHDEQAYRECGPHDHA
jgi:hypothetical protein